MKKLSCLRCQTPMDCLGREKIQLGETGFLLGDLPNLFAGAMEVEIYTCPSCGKVELFRPILTKGERSGYSHPELPQRECPHCGEKHDFDYPKCPYCEFDYYRK